MRLSPEATSLALSRVSSYALRSLCWVVIVYPTGSPNFEGFAKVFTCVCPLGSTFSGRTALFPNGSRISIVASDIPIFIPSSHSFIVMFLGWGADESSSIHYGDMKKWREAATTIISLSSIGPNQAHQN